MMGEEERLSLHATASANKNNKDDNVREDRRHGRRRDTISVEPGRQRHMTVGGKGMCDEVMPSFSTLVVATVRSELTRAVPTLAYHLIHFGVGLFRFQVEAPFWMY